MATQAHVRRISLSLPATEQVAGRFAFAVRNKGKLKAFAWVWMERVSPGKPRVPEPRVLAVRTATLDDRERMIAQDPAKFFTEPHYKGFPAVLVRLPARDREGARVDHHGRVALPGLEGLDDDSGGSSSIGRAVNGRAAPGG